MNNFSNNRVMEVQGFEELMKWLDETGKINHDIYFPVHDAMSQAVQLVEGAAKQGAPVAFGMLRASIGSEVVVTETAMEGIVSTSLGKAAGGKLVGYAAAVEFGSRPHFPPLRPLIEWLRVKKLSGVFSRKSGRRLGNATRQLAEDAQMARAIQRKIGKKGTRAQPFFFPALDGARDQINRLFDQALDALASKFGVQR